MGLTNRGGYWGLTLYPEAGEAGGCYVAPFRPLASGGRSDPERAELEAVRRARGKVRRYCATHRLNRFVTLTYAGEGCHDPVELRRHVGEFFKGLRRSSAASRCRMCGRRSGIRAGMACTFTSRSAATSSRS